jgi:hypothetical protein
MPSLCFGAIAQLGERLHGMQEVGGSIPPSSTKVLKTAVRRFFFACRKFWVETQITLSYLSNILLSCHNHNAGEYYFFLRGSKRVYYFSSSKPQ